MYRRTERKRFQFLRFAQTHFLTFVYFIYYRLFVYRTYNYADLSRK